MIKSARFLCMSLVLLPGTSLWGGTIQTSYEFTGSAKNVVISNGFLTADGVASGSLGNLDGVGFDTHNDVNLTTLQNYGTFTMSFPNGSTAFGNLHENDVNVSLATFSGPFTQTLTFMGGTGQFADVSGVLSGGGYIYPTYYTTSGKGTLAAPGLIATPEPALPLMVVTGLGLIFLRLLKRAAHASSPIRLRR